MARLLVTGGRQSKSASSYEFGRSDLALALIVDTDDLSVERALEYRSPSGNRAHDGSSMLFKSGHLEDGTLYVSTTTEALRFELASGNLESCVSHACMNDVHHVRPGLRDSLIVTSTGLDAVFEFTLDGDVLEEWSTTGQSIWDRFDRGTDYRLVESTKPHATHPNFSFYVKGELYVNLCDRRRAVCLTGRGGPFQYGGVGAGHDGMVHRGSVYFTNVEGRIAALSADTQAVELDLDLNRGSTGSQALGWCRGIEVLEGGETLVVGFSRLRPTRWKENVRWLKYRAGFGDQPKLPTRIASVNAESGELNWEVDLEPHGLGELFSIMKLD